MSKKSHVGSGAWLATNDHVFTDVMIVETCIRRDRWEGLVRKTRAKRGKVDLISH